jgi:uncharacterized protein
MLRGMKIVISGQSGFIGTKLTAWFTAKGHTVVGVGRADFAKGPYYLASIISGSDFLINLAGAPLVRRWTRSYSKKIWDSRIITTRLLSDAIAGCKQRPKAFISISGIGIYDSEGVHTETENELDEGFIGILCQRWEEEALRSRIHCNTYIIRTGVILGRDGGALPLMSLPFKWFVGGKIGSGNQIISWIHINDFARALELIMGKLPEQNIFNLTSPSPVSNKEFSSILAKTLGRPNLIPVPGFALKLLFGEGATMVLNGQYAIPKNLMNEGFIFQFPDLERAMGDLLG